MANRPEDLRNVVLIGHTHSGKTALVDALAFHTKVTNRHGTTADGSSISDTEPEEKTRKHTLSAHLFGLTFDGCRINLFDTPGHQDFYADAFSALQVAETAVLCFSAVAHVTFHARRLWSEAGRAGVGRAVVMTHIDAENTDFAARLAELQSVFGDVVVPLSYPDKSGHGVGAVHDVLAGQGPMAKTYREKLEERVAESDDALLEAYLDSGELPAGAMEKHLAAAVAKGKLVPLFTVIPPKMLGVEHFLRDLVRVFPSPIAFGARAASKVEAAAFDQLVEPDPAAPFAAKVFKVLVDPYVGRLSFLRCFRGRLKAEEGFFNVRTGKHDKVGGLLHVVGHENKPVDQVVSGDLFAVSKLETLSFGDTVTTDSAPLKFAPVAFPPPVYSLAVMPASRGDEQKIAQGLEKLHAEDPTFLAKRQEVTAELVVSGSSPLHLEVQLGRLQRRYGVGTTTHAPSIPYKETITAKAEGHHRHKKQSGGRGQFGEVYLRVEPLERGAGFDYVNGVVGGSIPRQFIPEIEKGIRKFMAKGGLAGCVVEDIRVEVYDGKFHDVDSDQISFQIAGERAFADAFAKARPILLEPYVDVEIHVPERFTGDVAGNLSSIRGRLSGMEVHEGIQVISAQVPLKEMQDYSTQLRSITAGEGTFTMRPSHYEQVPPNIQNEIVAEYKRKQEHEKGQH
jgi:elongation factor G